MDADGYDGFATYQHLVFQDWNAALERHAGLFGPLLEEACGPGPLRILDCTCGIGTQALGLARRGHAVTGTDLSAPAVTRARSEAEARGIHAGFQAADLRDLSALPPGHFDAVLAADNALPHVPGADLPRAAQSIASRLRPGGVFVATIRDYDAVLALLPGQRPTADPPRFYSDRGRRRIVHQVWDWIDEASYRFHLYLTLETDGGWLCRHCTSVYHPLRRDTLSTVLTAGGFGRIEWRMPPDNGFYQPIVIARRLDKIDGQS